MPSRSCLQRHPKPLQTAPQALQPANKSGIGGFRLRQLLLGGWRSRAMLDRYGRAAAAADRAAEAYRRLSVGDRI